MARNLQKISSVFILLIAICLISLLNQTNAQAKLEETFSKNQTEQIFTLIERYIDNNPEIVLKALEKIQSKEKIMSKKPRTTGEHIIALYGHITGLKKSITKIETNDLKHMHQDIDKLDSKFKSDGYFAAILKKI